MSSVKEIEKCFSSCHERGKKIKDNRNKIERKKTPDSYPKRDRDLGRGGVYKCYVKKQTNNSQTLLQENKRGFSLPASTWNINKDLNQLRCEVGNIVKKLDTMMARQQETKDRGKFRMKLHLSRLISDQKINYVWHEIYQSLTHISVSF